MYWHDIWVFPGSREHEYKCAGRYGAKGEKRQPRRKATPEQIRKQNQANKEKLLRRLIKQNFAQEDLWVTLKYPKGTRKPLEEVRKDFKNFCDAMRRAYKKRDEPFKWIRRIEVGSRGGIHIHILLNRIRGKPDTDVLVQRAWKHGRAHFESIYERGGYHDLACYIVKPPSGEMEGQMSLFTEEEQKQMRAYSCSRNLTRPEPERKEYTRRTMRKVLEEGPEPTPGYYIDKDSVVAGINPFTGMSYLQYTEYLIKPERGGTRTDEEGG